VSELPYIDAHQREIQASPERVWGALATTIGRLWPRLPGFMVSAWGLEPRAVRGAWDSDVRVGDAIPGFDVEGSERPRVLSLAGQHRFSEYRLEFELRPSKDLITTTLVARSFAAFPGLKGAAYRALVIRSRGHRVAVRRMLAQVARRAEQPT
jgi:hypothetical protein